MSRKLVSVFAVLGLLFAASFSVSAESTKTKLSIQGMTCGGCVATVKLQLKKTEGVTAYHVSLEKAEAEVSYDPARTDPMKIAESVSKTGFQASVKEEPKQK